MSRSRAPQHLLSGIRFVRTAKGQAPNPGFSKSNTAANRRLFATLEKEAAETTTNNSGSLQRTLASYVTAGATVGAITCYRSDSVIAKDPYNFGGSVVGVLAFYSTNPTFVSLPALLVSVVAGEFLGNGLRHLSDQFSPSIKVNQRHEDRQHLIQAVSEITAHDDGIEVGKDVLKLFETTIETVMLQAKTRWTHLSGFCESVPDHMTQHELKIAIHRWAIKEAEENPQGAVEEREALLQVLSVADINNDGIITFMEFSRALLLLELAKQKITSAKSELYFRAIDLNNSGSISRDELLHFARRLHALGGIPHKDRTTPHWSGMYERPSTAEEICEKWMNRFDVNHDGVISRGEFDKMAKEIDFGPSFLFTKYFDRSPE